MTVEEARAILGPELVARLEQAPPDPALTTAQLTLLAPLLAGTRRGNTAEDSAA